MSAWRSWSPADDDTLEAMRLDGRTVAAIAAALGRTKPAVTFRVKVLGVVRFRPRRAQYLAAFARCRTCAQVAAELGVQVRSVHRMRQTLRKAGYAINDARHGGPLITDED